MSKSAALVILLATTFLLSYCSGEKITWKSWSLNGSNQWTTAFLADKTLYTVSYLDGDYKIIQHDKDQGKTKEICQIKLNPKFAKITEGLRAVEVYHRIVVSGIRNIRNSSDSGIKSVEYVLLVIDPIRCTYDLIDGLIDELPDDQAHILPEVLVHRNTFDVFLPSRKKCTPCNFYINGDKLSSVYHSEFKYKNQLGNPYYLKEIGLTYKYVYLYKSDNETTNMTLLDRLFDVVPSKDIKFPGEVYKLATSSKQDGEEEAYVGVIYPSSIYGPSNLPILTVLNSELGDVYTTTLPLLKEHNFVDASMVIDSHGKTFVTFIQRFDKSDKITHVRFDEKGQNLGDEEVGKPIPVKGTGYYKMQSFFDGQDYCFTIHEPNKTNVTCYDFGHV